MSRAHLITIVLSSVLAAGCVTTEQKTLATGGTPLPVGGSDDTASPSGGDPDDTGMTGGEGYPPVVESVTATWNAGTDGWYIESILTYTDEDDDVRTGGMVGVTLVVNDETYATEWLAIDGSSAIHEDEVNEVRFNPQPPDVAEPSDVNVEMLVQLKDALENRSNEFSVTPQ